jgi:hypothetical protein
MGQPVPPEWTRQELYRFAADRMTADPHPDLIVSWAPGERQMALVLASGRELPHEENAPPEVWDPRAWRKANPAKWRDARMELGLDLQAVP